MTLDEIEQMTDGQVVARRNVAMGLWAGRKIGLRGRALDAYVLDVMRSDQHIPGPDDVIEKIQRDFIIHGVDCNAADIEAQLQKQERLTWQQLAVTD